MRKYQYMYLLQIYIHNTVLFKIKCQWFWKYLHPWEDVWLFFSIKPYYDFCLFLTHYLVFGVLSHLRLFIFCKSLTEFDQNVCRLESMCIQYFDASLTGLCVLLHEYNILYIHFRKPEKIQPISGRHFT